MTTTNPINAKITITDLNLLPETLRAMAKQAAGRRSITAVVVSFTDGLASKSYGWSSDSRAIVLGQLVRREVHSWVGSDGESNVTTTDSYSCAVASSRHIHHVPGCRVTIGFGNLPRAMAEQLHDATLAEFMRLLPVAVDTAIAAEVEAGEQVELVDSYDSTVTGGSKGSKSAMVSRSSLSVDAQPFESKASKANTIKISSIGYTSHAQARSNARHGGNVSSSAHVDAMVAAGWLS